MQAERDVIPEGYARVTEIIQRVSKTLGEDEFEHIDPTVIEEKGRIGTETHEAISAYIDGDFHPVSQRATGYFRSFTRWWDSLGTPLVVIAKERRFHCHDLKVSGACDLILCSKKYSGNRLVDYKTSASEGKLTWPIQATFYRYLAEINGYPTDTTAIFVQLCPRGGGPKIHLYNIDDQYHRLMISMVDCHKYFGSVKKIRDKCCNKLRH